MFDKMCAAIWAVWALSFSWTVGAQQIDYPKIPINREQLEALKNQNLLSFERYTEFSPLIGDAPQVGRPFSEFEETGYLIFSAQELYSSGPLKRKIAEELPEGVQLIVYTHRRDEKQKESILKKYPKLAEEGRIQVIYLPQASEGFWSRDGLPVPTVGRDNPLTLVDAKYYYDFEPDRSVAEMFKVPLLQHQFYFEGGNFIVNSVGDCLIVDNERAELMPDHLFETKYGCKRLLRLPFVTGIGHADEVVRFVEDQRVFTSIASYEPLLTAFGLEVVLLPRPNRGEYRTYINSLLINGTVFVPIYEVPTDEAALAAYEALGWKVVPLVSRNLSDRGLGSIHCITMTYPPVPLAILLKDLGGELL